MMLFKAILLSVFLATCLVAAHKKQSKVPANLNCECAGYQAKAKECKWTDTTCSEVANSGFQNYKSWCLPINAFRDAKRFGFTSAEFVRYIPCSIGNLNKDQVTAQRANLKLEEPKTPKYLVSISTANVIVPFTTAPVTTTKTWPQSAVKNQGSCGSCWAFATTGFAEAYTIKNGGALTTDYSEQRLVSCATDSFGCNGGFIHKALDYLSTTGTTTETTTPYLTANGTCAAGVTTGLTKLPPVYYEWYTSTSSSNGVLQNGNCNRMKQLLTRGPVVISFDVRSDFQTYKSGIYKASTSTCVNTGRTNNHAMLLTGYIANYNGTTSNVYQIKNSWGANWGVGGYIYVEDVANVSPCGLCSWFTYV